MNAITSKWSRHRRIAQHLVDLANESETVGVNHERMRTSKVTSGCPPVPSSKSQSGDGKDVGEHARVSFSTSDSGHRKGEIDGAAFVGGRDAAGNKGPKFSKRGIRYPNDFDAISKRGQRSSDGVSRCVAA